MNSAAVCIQIAEGSLLDDGLFSPQEWRTPSLGTLNLFPDSEEEATSLPESERSSTITSLPREILDEVALACLVFKPQIARSTLASFALASSAFTLSAQRALLAGVQLYEPWRINLLTETLQTKPHLGRACTSLKFRVASPRKVFFMSIGPL